MQFSLHFWSGYLHQPQKQQWFFKDIMYQTNGWTKWQILHTPPAYFITAALTAVCSSYTHQGAYVQPPAADDRKHAHFYDNQQHHLDNHITKAQHSPKSETAKFMLVNYVLLISILITLYVYLIVVEKRFIWSSELTVI